MIQKILRAGLQYDLPDYLERRVVPTNVVTLLLLIGVAIPFFLLTVIYVPLPILLIFPSAGIITCVGVLIANQFGGIKISRFFLACLPVYEINLYNAYLSNPDEQAMVGPFLIGLGFILVPFLVIDLKEKVFLAMTVLICAIPVIGWPWFRDVLNLTPEQVALTANYTTSLRFGWLNYLFVIVGVVVSFGSMLGMVSISRKAEKESELARQEAEKNNQELQEQQVQLHENLKKVEQAQEEDRRRNWAGEGVTKMSEILRSGKNSQEIFDSAISMIVSYVKANQGGLFVVDKDEAEEETIIKLRACYAYSKKKFIEKEVLPGQGLIGQAYMEGEAIHMTAIPQNYVHITSGLGEATPSSLYVLPLKVNEITEGLIEIAAFHKFEAHELDLLNRLGENLASYIQSNRINERTKTLLEEAQQQAEELKAQEEEMHQNMEELAATQEEMQRKEKEYQEVIEELKQELASSSATSSV